MEEFPTSELVPTKQDIIKRLKSEGLNNKTLDLFTEYLERKEKEVTTAREAVELNIDRIEFYFAVDNAEGAWDVAKEAYENARREGEEDLADKLLERFPELELG